MGEGEGERYEREWERGKERGMRESGRGAAHARERASEIDTSV